MITATTEQDYKYISRREKQKDSVITKNCPWFSFFLVFSGLLRLHHAWWEPTVRT